MTDGVNVACPLTSGRARDRTLPSMLPPKVISMITHSRRFGFVLISALILLSAVAPAYAQDAIQSAALAKELGQAMDAKKLMTIAAKDPSNPDAFVAAMYFSGSQLLVVAAQYDPAVLLNEKLEKKEYQEIYIDLNSAAKAGTRVFFEDAGADGLKAEREDGKSFDTCEVAGKRTVFDAQWRKDQKLTDEAYTKLYSDADKTYGRLLQLLVKQTQK